eukprot:1083723-Pyramimonas_sp.AAC.1
MTGIDLLIWRFGAGYTQYAIGDPLTLWVNKVGPYNNPQETYNYYELPFCKPKAEKGVHKWGGLGEVLEGNELIDSQIDIRFRMEVQKRVICSEILDEKTVNKFKHAIKHHYCVEHSRYSSRVRHSALAGELPFGYWYLGLLHVLGIIDYGADDLPIWGFVGEFVSGDKKTNTEDQ